MLCVSPFLKCMLAGRPYRLAMALPRECYYFAYLMLLGYALVFSLLLLPTALQNWLPFFFVLFLTLTPACGPCPLMFISGLGYMRPMGTCGVRCARAISISQTQNSKSGTAKWHNKNNKKLVLRAGNAISAGGVVEMRPRRRNPAPNTKLVRCGAVRGRCWREKGPCISNITKVIRMNKNHEIVGAKGKDRRKVG